ncbi:MAG: hypothetical protein JXA87_15890 [Thermoleophilia bacterium]|nr:hypothetical protein [Thermoleophilia bacterium]
MNHVEQLSRSSSTSLANALALRPLGVVLPMLINYGHLLLSGGDSRWAPVILSFVAAVIPLVLLMGRGDRRGAAWVGTLFFPLNAWPIVSAAMSSAL